MVSVRSLRFLLVLLFASVMTASCSTTGFASGETPSTPTYTLGSGDRVRVTVFGEQSLNGEYPVGPDGSVALPLIGNVMASGLTVADLQQTIVNKLSPAFLLDPRVSVDVANFRPFYVLGEVGRPGSYPYVDGLSVNQAVAIAGGYSYRANTRKIFIRRSADASEQVYLNTPEDQVWVRPGDTIRIVERLF